MLEVNNKHVGECCICGRVGELTFEHIPPKKAYNWQCAKLYNGEEAIKRSNDKPAKYINLQQGMGKYSLCKECNNNTGTWYAPDYCDFAMDVIKALHKNEPLEHGDIVTYKLKNCPVLPIAKQVIAMFCSLLSYQEVHRLGFDKLLLDKESNIVNKCLFDLRMFLTPNESGQIMIGPSAVLHENENRIESVLVVDLGVYPFGFILNLTPEVQVKYGLSIMNMFNVKYNDKCDFELPLMYLERRSNTFPLPLMFKDLPYI